MTTHTRSGIPLKSFYSPEDIQDLDYEKNLNAPGAFPYTRGRSAKTTGAWIQRELSGEGEPSRSNEQLKYLIEKGQMGVDVIGDSPTMALLDPDHPLALNTLGTQGVSLCCLQDYRELFKDLPLDRISVSSSVPPAFALAGLYLVARENGFAADKLRGSVLQAPFYAEDCGYAMHLPISLRLRMAGDCIQFCAQEMPKFHSFVEDTYFFSEAGLNAVEEMALGFIEIRHIVRQLLRRGVAIDSFAPRIAILVNCGMDFFEEIAKIRASRRLFARMMQAEFGAKDPRSLAVVITSHTSGLSLTAQQPFNNIVRGAIQAVCLVMAGVQAMEISAFDEAYRTPSPESHLVGLRTQQVVQLESNVAAVQDPLGGSYFIESLTDEMEKRIDAMIEDIESKGDPAMLSEKGWFKKFFENSMNRYHQQIGNGELPKVGVNIHRIPDHEDTLLKEISEGKIEPCRGRAEKIRQYKRSRDSNQINAVLQGLYQRSKSENENIMPAIITATAAGATMGEIAGVLRQAYDYPYDPHGLIEPPL
ncbi:MAG: acyl-CoA mutase large subunit family protein [Desulfobacterales bacterium]|nr:MAG: acyl-CoA mutase large subunit family protein [Desulfobacterales bacterium]